MRALIQRVTEANVVIDNNVAGEIEAGLVVFVGIETEDDDSDAEWLARKIAGLRIFSDAEGKMNLSIDQVNGNALVISQFTLHASYKKGNRPSFMKAARPEVAIPLYNLFISRLGILIDKELATGEFGAMMKINLVNDGPVTIFMDSKQPE